MVVMLVGATTLSGCALLGPPVQTSPPPQEQSAPVRHSVVPQQPAQPPAVSPPVTPPPAAVPPPPARHFQLGAAAASLVGIAQGQEREGQYGLAAQTLERALAIEPRNPLVWIALGEESLAAHSPAQAYGMARKALYLAEGAPDVQARAWGLIAASLRAQGQDQAAVAAEQKAAELYPH